MPRDFDFNPDSPTLKRLIEEVRNDIQTGEIVNYNRMHNRHNRSGARGYSYYTSEELAEFKARDEKMRLEDEAEEKALKEKLCKVCGKPLEDDAESGEERFFLIFGGHKQCLDETYVRESE